MARLDGHELARPDRARARGGAPYVRSPRGRASGAPRRPRRGAGRAPPRRRRHHRGRRRRRRCGRRAPAARRSIEPVDASDSGSNSSRRVAVEPPDMAARPGDVVTAHGGEDLAGRGIQQLQAAFGAPAQPLDDDAGGADGQHLGATERHRPARTPVRGVEGDEHLGPADLAHQRQDRTIGHLQVGDEPLRQASLPAPRAVTGVEGEQAATAPVGRAPRGRHRVRRARPRTRRGRATSAPRRRQGTPSRRRPRHRRTRRPRWRSRRARRPRRPPHGQRRRRGRGTAMTGYPQDPVNPGRHRASGSAPRMGERYAVPREQAVTGRLAVAQGVTRSADVRQPPRWMISSGVRRLRGAERPDPNAPVSSAPTAGGVGSAARRSRSPAPRGSASRPGCRAPGAAGARRGRCRRTAPRARRPRPRAASSSPTSTCRPSSTAPATPRCRLPRPLARLSASE